MLKQEVIDKCGFFVKYKPTAVVDVNNLEKRFG